MQIKDRICLVLLKQLIQIGEDPIEAISLVPDEGAKALPWPSLYIHG